MSPMGPVAALLLGLFGTAHCVGMCGPIVMATAGKTGRLAPQLLYHAGRITTYTLVSTALGAIAELAGGASAVETGKPLSALAHAQVVLSLAAATLMLLLGAARLGILREPGWLTGLSVSKLPGLGALRGQIARGRVLAMLPLGLLLGLLPCGLSYGAFAAALASGSAGAAAMTGLAFGVGTLPGLLLLGTALARSVRRHQRLVDAAAGALLVAFGALIASDALAVLVG